MDGIDGLAAGDPVTAEQMRALFGCGLHPLADLLAAAAGRGRPHLRDFQNVTGWGRRSRSSTTGLNPFQLGVARRIAALNGHRMAGRRLDRGG